jgi:hypothetical protein
MLAVSLDNLLFFLLIAVAALFQLLSKAMSKAGKSDSNETPSSPTPQTPRPVQRAPRESDAERIRKFLEALGQPPGSTPPPPVIPRTEIPPRPVTPPPVMPRAWRLPRERPQEAEVTQRESRRSEKPRGLPEIVPPVPAPAAATFEVHEVLPVEPQQPLIIATPVEASAAPKRIGAAKRPDSKNDIATLLASTSSLREAIILREIFGPPRGLQTFDL